MTALTAEILRDELRRCTDDFIRLALRTEIEQYFGEKGGSTADKSRVSRDQRFSRPEADKRFSDQQLLVSTTTSMKKLSSFQSVSGSCSLQRLSAPVDPRRRRETSVRFGHANRATAVADPFKAEDADLFAAVEPKVRHWQRSTLGVTRGQTTNAGTSGAPDLRSDPVPGRTTGTLSPRGQDSSWAPSSWKSDMPGPLSSVMGRRSWQSRHRSSFRQLGMVQERLTEPGAYQALPLSNDSEAKLSTIHDSESRLSTVQDSEPRRSTDSGFALTSSSSITEEEKHDIRSSTKSLDAPAGQALSRPSVGFTASTSEEDLPLHGRKSARPRKTMRADIKRDGWMHRFRKGKTGETTQSLIPGLARRDSMISITTELEGDSSEDDEGRGDRATGCFHCFSSLMERLLCCFHGCSSMEDLAGSNKFNLFSGFLVISNAVSIGVQTNYMAVHWCQEVPETFRVLEQIFCALFSLELAIRLAAYGCRFFYTDGWRWNMFDALMVTLQITEVCLEQHSHLHSDPALSGHWSSFRMLRLVRIIRLARILHLISELRMLVVSISHSIRSLGWVVLLLLVMIYVIAVYLTQIVTDHKVYASKESLEEEEDLLHFYGSLDRSVLSLYAMVSEGIHWDQLMDPLAKHISPWLRLLFFFFSAFAIFAVMNVVTGVFVESALTTATEDRKVSITTQMRTLFEKVDDDGSGDITWEEFQGYLNHPQMQACLKEIDVNNDDAHELFRLLDIDNSGTIDIDELVHGCLRLMGWAKAIDLATFMNEYRIVTLRWARHARFLEECLDLIMVKLDMLARAELNHDTVFEEDESAWGSSSSQMSAAFAAPRTSIL